MDWVGAVGYSLRVLGEYLDLRGRKWREAGEDCIMRGFVFCTLHRTLLRWSNWDGRGM